MLTESMIRASEIRTAGALKDLADQKSAVTASMEEGYILTQYFYDALAAFEKDPVGLRDAYPDMLYAIDLPRELKRASLIQFAAQASPEVLATGRPRRQNSPTLKLAEQKLAIGDIESAQKLAQQVLDEKKEDAGRALFILARASSMSRDPDGARSYFERTIEVSKEPTIIAWSHIYLGRILDLQDKRDDALDHYRAALQAGDSIPEIKTAAQRGLQQPYETAAPAQPQPE
jgi:tetratricopeptide (TPR) repeat protein